jgi:uncharacterized DUF497 family protein
MDKYYTLNGIAFVWDQDKSEKNTVKHDGISFEQAAQAFFDPFLRIMDASRNNEARESIIGMDKQWNLLFVVHLLIEENEVVRIISARKATRTEREFYEN